jgi:hypothetical protein
VGPSLQIERIGFHIPGTTNVLESTHGRLDQDAVMAIIIAEIGRGKLNAFEQRTK